MKRKILIALESLGGGGVERVASILAPALQNDYLIEVISTVDSEPTLLSPNIPFNYLGSKSKNKFLRLFERTYKLYSFYKRNKYDLILCMGLTINILTLFYKFFFKNTIVIISERNDPNRIKNPIVVKIRNHLYRSADLLVCQTSDSKKYYQANGVKKIAIIANPVNEKLPLWDLKDAEHIVVNFCRLEPQKNLKLLIDAFSEFRKKHKSFKLRIFGDGSQKQMLEHYITSKDLNSCIEILPFSKDIHHVVKKCYMFVSSSDYEGMSNSMLEALAMGVPSVITDCPIGGAHDIVENNYNGILVPCRNIEMMVQGMTKIADDDKLAQLLSKNAMNVRKKLNLNSIILLWQNAIKGTLE